MALLVSAKLINVQVPFIFKDAVNFLNEHCGDALTMNSAPEAVLSTATALVVGCK